MQLGIKITMFVIFWHQYTFVIPCKLYQGKQRRKSFFTFKSNNLHSFCTFIFAQEQVDVGKLGYQCKKKISFLYNICMQMLSRNRVLKKCVAENDSEFLILEKREMKEKNYQRWSIEQNRSYALFLEENKIEFETNKDRRSMKFFSQMAEHLEIGKNNLQCRSHHQKMMKKYGCVERIIQHFLGVTPMLERKPSVTKEISQTQNEDQNSFRVSKNSAWSFVTA